jgi:hypothetical protein
MNSHIEPTTAGKYKRRMDEFKEWLFWQLTNDDSGLSKDSDEWKRLRSYLVAPPSAHADFDPLAHEGAARRADLRLDSTFEVRDWHRFIMTRTLGRGDKALLKGIGTLSECVPPPPHTHPQTHTSTHMHARCVAHCFTLLLTAHTLTRQSDVATCRQYLQVCSLIEPMP